MALPFKTFMYIKGDTPQPIRFRLVSRNVRSAYLKPRPGIGDVIEITFAWPGKPPVVLSTAANGTLTVDPITRLVTCPVSQPDLNTLSPGQSANFVVRVINEAGVRATWGRGAVTLSKEVL